MRPTSPQLPSLTTFDASLSASSWTKTCTTSRWPWCAAASSGVAPTYGAHPRVSAWPLRPTRATSACTPLSSNHQWQETPPPPDLERCSVLEEGGGGAAAVAVIRCAHLSHTRRGACLLLENANSRTRSTCCSHVRRASQSSARCMVLVVHAQEKKAGRGRLQKRRLGSIIELSKAPSPPSVSGPEVSSYRVQSSSGVVTTKAP